MRVRSLFARFLGALLLVGALIGPAAAAGKFARDIVVIHTSGASYRFNVELAVSSEERAQGLMYRQDMARDAGMLFLYNQDQAVTFWMKNTYLPLDMIFIAADGKITQIVRSAQPFSENLIPSNGYIRGVLEVNAGVADQYGIQPGDQVLYSAFKMPAPANSKTPGQ